MYTTLASISSFAFTFLTFSIIGEFFHESDVDLGIILYPFGMLASILLWTLTMWLGNKKNEPNLLASVLLGAFFGGLIAFSMVFYRWQRDLSPILFKAEYYDEDGFDLYLRADGTFKLKETGWVVSTTYGKYEIDRDTIFLSKPVLLKTGKSKLSPHFYRVGDKLQFYQDEAPGLMQIRKDRLR